MIKIIHLPFPEGDGSETVAAEEIGADTYTILENPIFSCRLNYGTTVKAIANEKGDLVVSKVIRASRYKTTKFLLSSVEDQRIIKEKIGPPLLEIGGTWEIAMGGLVFIHVPVDSHFELKKLFTDLEFYPTEIIDEQK